MRTAIDTNILSTLWSQDPLAEEMARQLSQAKSEGGLVVAAPVYAELLAHPQASPEFVEGFLRQTGVDLDFRLEEAVWRAASSAFEVYSHRRRASGGSQPKRLLVDFLVGAHASLRADRLLTLDLARYRQDFPALRIGLGAAAT